MPPSRWCCAESCGRNRVLEFFDQLPPIVIGIEACGAAHYWARELRKLGHEVKLMAPQHVKAYIRRNKNDGRDAEGVPAFAGTTR